MAFLSANDLIGLLRALNDVTTSSLNGLCCDLKRQKFNFHRSPFVVDVNSQFHQRRKRKFVGSEIKNFEVRIKSPTVTNIKLQLHRHAQYFRYQHFADSNKIIRKSIFGDFSQKVNKEFNQKRFFYLQVQKIEFGASLKVSKSLWWTWGNYFLAFCESRRARSLASICCSPTPFPRAFWCTSGRSQRSAWTNRVRKAQTVRFSTTRRRSSNWRWWDCRRVHCIITHISGWSGCFQAPPRRQFSRKFCRIKWDCIIFEMSDKKLSFL